MAETGTRAKFSRIESAVAGRSRAPNAASRLVNPLRFRSLNPALSANPAKQVVSATKPFLSNALRAVSLSGLVRSFGQRVDGNKYIPVNSQTAFSAPHQTLHLSNGTACRRR